MCHFLIFVPLVSLPLYSIFPWQEATALYALINGPILIAGWLVWRVHRRQPVTGREGMIGRKASAKTALMPEGMVMCGNELWRARSEASVNVGEIVRVTAVENLVLSVVPIREEDSTLCMAKY
jgi:membrane-bound ClpP family serine protease